MKTALTIAGSDSSGGAGIQADIKTMISNGVYAMSAITAITAQNTLGVTAISEISADILGKQLDCVFTDIYPDAVKTGMIPSAELIYMTAERLKFYKAKNIVADPVMVATSGSKLMRDSALSVLCEKLLTIAYLVTPNIPEAQVLSDIEIKSERDMQTAARVIYERYGCNVLVKGGHSVSDANDLLYAYGDMRWYRTERIDNPNTHGTGCTLSSAIASNLAKGYDLYAAIERAKEYICRVLSAKLDLGNGNGPLCHGADLCSRFLK